MLAHGLLSVVVSLLLVAGAAAATLPPPLVAVPSVAAVLGAGIAATRRVWRQTCARIGVSEVGITVVGVTDADQVGWSAIRAVTGHRAGRRIRVHVATNGRAAAPPAAFTATAARTWLDACQRLAAARRLEPVAAPAGLGFVAAGAADADLTET